MIERAGRPNQREPSLDDAMARLDAVLAGRAAGPGVSFDVSTPAPERELLAALEPATDAGLSFAVADEAAGERAATSMLDEMIANITTRAKVETEHAGQVVASTAVGLAGDISSRIAPALESEQLERHLDDLRDKLRKQREQTELLLSVLQMAAKITLAAGTGNPLLAVPTALQFIRSVIAERNTEQS